MINRKDCYGMLLQNDVLLNLDESTIFIILSECYHHNFFLQFLDHSMYSQPCGQYYAHQRYLQCTAETFSTFFCLHQI